MSTYAKLATEAGDQYLTALAENQERFLSSIAAFSASAGAVPAFAAAFPTLQEINEANFAFASKLLKQQKDFIEKLLGNGVTPKSPSAKAKAKG